MDSSSTTPRHFTMGEINSKALDLFVHQPVSKQMIAYLSGAAFNVIACDTHLMPPGAAEAQRKNQLPPTPPRTPEPRSVGNEDGDLPTLEAFITQLVLSSNVQVPTLMSTLVYLGRLKSKLQPMARGLRCTTHRIFLAALILAAKYLNDSSPKNKHWATYSHIDTDFSNFGFSRSEVNLMERQLLLLLDWDLRISEEDLYQEFEPFLAPIRADAQHILQEEERRRVRKAVKAQKEKAMYMAMNGVYPSPSSSRDNSRSRRRSPEHIRDYSNSSSLTPPPLVHSSSYSSSSMSSYAPSVDSASIRSRSSRATTPPDVYATDEPYMYVPDGSMYDSPVEVHFDRASSMPKRKEPIKAAMLPYEVSPEDLADMHYAGGKAIKRPRFGSATGRTMLDRFLGAVTVR